MSLFYTVSYLLGSAPWESAATHPAAVKQVLALFDREERERGRPFGRALDLGCGRGHWSVVLAQRGWSVTGVENVPRAVRAARRRAQRAGVEIQIVQCDATETRQAGVTPAFDFVWDFGMLHGLPPPQFRSVAHELGALASEHASMLMLAWAPGHRGPLPRGLSAVQIEKAFAGWTIQSAEPFDSTGLPRPLRNVRPMMYRLRRSNTH